MLILVFGETVSLARLEPSTSSDACADVLARSARTVYKPAGAEHRGRHHRILQVVPPLAGLFPLVAQTPSDRDPRRVPGERARCGQQGEPRKRHLVRACGDGDDGAHHGDEATEQDDRGAVPFEPREALVHVGLLETDEAPDAGEESLQTLVAHEATDPVEDVCADDRTDSRSDHPTKETEAPFAHVEAGEQQNEFGRDGREDALERHQNSDSDEPDGVDDIRRPLDHVVSLLARDGQGQRLRHHCLLRQEVGWATFGAGRLIIIDRRAEIGEQFDPPLDKIMARQWPAPTLPYSLFVSRSTRIALVRRPGPRLSDGIVTHIGRSPIDLHLAMKQWTNYVDAVRDAGWKVVEVPPADDCPDAVFIEDAVVLYRGTAIITRPGDDARKPETTAVEPVVAELGCRVERIVAPGTMDGGDVLKVPLPDGDTIFVGLGARTNAEGLCQFAAIVQPLGAKVVGVPLTKVLHLKSAATALTDGTIVGWEPGLDSTDAFPRFEAVSQESGAHVVLLEPDLILMAADAPRVATNYRARGYRTIEVDISEFIKLEGCVTCLSVRIRELP